MIGGIFSNSTELPIKETKQLTMSLSDCQDHCDDPRVSIFNDQPIIFSQLCRPPTWIDHGASRRSLDSLLRKEDEAGPSCPQSPLPFGEDRREDRLEVCLSK
jgi:hypothetical protein